MKYSQIAILLLPVFLLCGCTVFHPLGAAAFLALVYPPVGTIIGIIIAAIWLIYKLTQND